MRALALQKAIFSALADISAPVFDKVPQDQEYPYVTYVSADTADADFLVERMDEVSVTLQAWSRAGGQQEVQEIMAEIVERLDRKKLPLDSGNLINLRVTRTRTAREDDTETYMGQVSTLAQIHE